MLKWFLPREDRFFGLIHEQAETALSAVRTLIDLLKNYQDVQQKVEKIHQLEHDGDNLFHTINNSLDSTFVTPIDREDIHALSFAMDKVVDFIDAGAKRLVLFHIKKPAPAMLKLAEVLERAVIQLCKAVPKLSNPSFGEEIRVHLTEIEGLEKEGDRIHHSAIAQLFDEEKDAIKLIKVKEVMEFFENSIDMCQRVGHVIESIVVKNA
jgi:predicted phosphate transport protein (TIGR00153 family)